MPWKREWMFLGSIRVLDRHAFGLHGQLVRWGWLDLVEPVEEPGGAGSLRWWEETWPEAPDSVPQGRCRFVVSPPRNFLYPALLLLLTEEPRHGYLLCDALPSLGLGRMDRPSVYRALGELESDGLVRSWDAAPIAGSTRHVHAVTPEGEQALEAWMSIVSRERNSLDLVLQRYWFANARRLEGMGIDARGSAVDASTPAGYPDRFEVKADRSTLTVEARSSVGPIAFSSTSLEGWIDVELQDGLVAKDTVPAARLDVHVTELTSGNAIYDGELLRRVDARRYPVVTVELRSLHHMGEGNCYRVDGDVTLHGITQRIGGVITATAHERLRRSFNRPQQLERSLIVAGAQVLDISRFDLAVPAMPLFKIYPDVRLRLHLEADLMA
jgi:DNA-binding PadR family transcriptional regulator